jgi:hypothetical protein
MIQLFLLLQPQLAEDLVQQQEQVVLVVQVVDQGLLQPQVGQVQ